MENLRYPVRFQLIGSRATGAARDDSDFDLLLVANALVEKIVPRPLPHDAPDFYRPVTGVHEHHRRKNAWSEELWFHIGGDAAVRQFRTKAMQYLKHLGHTTSDDKLDLFLYLPPHVSQRVWAVELAWQDVHARYDFACQLAQAHADEYPHLRDVVRTIAASQNTKPEQLRDLELAIATHLGSAATNASGGEYAALSELRRDVPRYQAALAQTGLP